MVAFIPPVIETLRISILAYIGLALFRNLGILTMVSGFD